MAWAVAGACLVAGALSSAAMAWAHLTYPFPMDYAEGPCLDRALAVARGGSLYPPIGDPPYVAWVYTPLYAWLCALAARSAGATYAFGRALSLIATVAAALLIYAIARRQTGSRAWAVMAPLLFLGSHVVALWAAAMRVDMMGVALGLGGLAVLGAGSSLVLAGVLFGLAFLCKQSLVAGFAAAVLFLGFSRRRRDLALLVLSFAVVAGGTCAWMMWSTGGSFASHTVVANLNPWTFRQLVSTGGQSLSRHVIAAAVGLFGYLVLTRKRRLPLEGYYLLTAFATAMFAGKVGSGDNYFIDYVAALSLAAGVGGKHLADRINAEVRSGLGDLAVAVLLALHTFLAPPPMRVHALSAQTAGLAEVARALAHVPGPVLCEDPGLAPLAGHRIWLQPFEFTQMALSGRWDQTPVVEVLRRGEVAVVALQFDPWDARHRDPGGAWRWGRFTDEMVAAIRAAYRIERRIEGTYLLVPKAGPTTLLPDPRGLHRS